MKFSDEYSELYHYTSLNGLKGILGTQQIWATQYDKLNDSSEVQHLSSLLKEKIYPQIFASNCVLRHMNPEIYNQNAQGKSLEEISKVDADHFVASIHDVSFKGLGGKPPLTKPYISSFCTHRAGSYEQVNGLLSQWRAYGANKYSCQGNDGYFSIVFDSKTIEKMLSEESERFDYAVLSVADVIYDDDLQKFDREFEDLLEIFYKAEALSRVDDTSGLEELVKPYLRTAPRYKHRAFKEEQESRLIAQPTMYPDQEGEQLEEKMPKKEILFRESKGEKIPYIALFGQEKLPIKRIIVGPSINQTEVFGNVKMMMPSDIEVVRSETPFLG